MKKFLLSLLCLSTIFARADHNSGAELYWDCIKTGPNSGKYVFHLILYRACTGINLGPVTNLLSNSPVSSIPMTRVSQNSMAPHCYLGAGSGLDCYSVGKDTLVMEAHRYISAPVNIHGTPPLTGWEFSWRSCCRPDPALYGKGVLMDNLEPQNQSYQVSATMYPIPGQVAGQCYDSSPRFAELPAIIMCTGYSNIYTHYALDDDCDSLVYGFVAPSNSNGNPVTYASHLNTNQVTPRPHGGNFIVPSPGFSATVPLPWNHINMDTLNQPATINPNTGEISFLSYTRGAYVIGIKVDAYRNGIKTATVMRDVQLSLTDCPTLPGGSTTNSAPVISFHSVGKGTHFGAFADTVVAGQTINFQVTARDSQLVSSNQLQSIYLTSFGTQYGNALYNTSGCEKGECATLDTNFSAWNGSSWVDSIEVATDFNWNTSCTHLISCDGSFQKSKTFQFVFKATDDFCDVPRTSYATASITVVEDTSKKQLKIDSLLLTANSTQLFWKPASSGSFSHYYIFRSTNSSSGFVLLDSIPKTAATNYLDGSTSNGNFYSYFVKTTNTSVLECSEARISSTLLVNASKPKAGVVELIWNDVLPHDNEPVMYNIYRQDSSNAYLLIGNTNTNSFIDSALICLDTMRYIVEAVLNGVVYTSSLPVHVALYNVFDDSVVITNVIPDTTGNVLVSWIPVGPEYTDFHAYFIHTANDSIGPYTIVDSIPTKTTSTYYHTGAGADTTAVYYYISFIAFSDCLGKDTISNTSDTLNTHDIITGINDVNRQGSSVTVYPNPNNGRFEVAYTLTTNQLVTTELFDYTGKRVRHESIEQPSGPQITIIKLADQPKGLYLLQLTVGDTVYHKKVIYH